MALLFYALMYIPPALCGAEYIEKPWIIVSVLSAWIWSIWLKSDKGEINYKRLDGDSFMAKDKGVLVATTMRLITIAAVFYGARYLFR